eukprot:3108990-Prymnesium_polylepis.1
MAEVETAGVVMAAARVAGVKAAVDLEEEEQRTSCARRIPQQHILQLLPASQRNLALELVPGLEFPELAIVETDLKPRGHGVREDRIGKEEGHTHRTTHRGNRAHLAEKARLEEEDCVRSIPKIRAVLWLATGRSHPAAHLIARHGAGKSHQGAGCRRELDAEPFLSRQ